MPEELTDAVLEAECQEIAKGLVAVITAGLDRSLSVTDKIGVLMGEGLHLWGDIGRGLDQQAHVPRVAMEPAAHVVSLLATEMLPLTTPDSDDEGE